MYCLANYSMYILDTGLIMYDGLGYILDFAFCWLRIESWSDFYPFLACRWRERRLPKPNTLTPASLMNYMMQLPASTILLYHGHIIA